MVSSYVYQTADGTIKGDSVVVHYSAGRINTEDRYSKGSKAGYTTYDYTDTTITISHYGSQSLLSKEEYKINKVTKLATEVTYYYEDVTDPISRSVYIYDANRNIIEIQNYSLRWGGGYLAKYLYEYDDKLNPAATLPFFQIGNLSKNNPIKETSHDKDGNVRYTLTTSYTYSDKNLPVEAREGVGGVSIYEYDCE
jgi:hypothetical protein